MAKPQVLVVEVTDMSTSWSRSQNVDDGSGSQICDTFLILYWMKTWRSDSTWSWCAFGIKRQCKFCFWSHCLPDSLTSLVLVQLWYGRCLSSVVYRQLFSLMLYYYILCIDYLSSQSVKANSIVGSRRGLAYCYIWLACHLPTWYWVCLASISYGYASAWILIWSVGK
jgi:hypothetical protein